jgi:hypothetical protein
VGRAGTAEHVERIVRGWRRVDRLAEARETARRHTSRALHVYPDEDGMVVIRGRLAPEVGAVLIQALTAAREALYEKAHAENVPAETSGAHVSAEPPTMPQQQADALALVAETALHHGIDPGAPGERYQVVVHDLPNGFSFDLTKEADFIRTVRSGLLAASQFAPTLTDAQGTFSKPATW